MNKMYVMFVVILSSLVFSSAQPVPPPAEPSQECITAYNATFETPSAANCSLAYAALLLGNASSQQKMMVCDANQQCNDMIENITSSCGNTIDSPRALHLDLLCTSDSNGMSCYSHYANGSYYSLVGMIFGSCQAGSCNQTCNQSLMQINDNLGCCALQIISALVDEGSIASSQVSFISNTFPELCGLAPLSFCNGSTFPEDPCGVATLNLQTMNDNCSMAIQQLGGDSSSLIYLYLGDCPTRFQSYVTACSEQFGNDTNDILQLANGAVTINQARDSNGRSCTDFLPEFLSDDDDDDDEDSDCTGDYFNNQCSDGCRQSLRDTTTEYGCCFNTIFGEFAGRSASVSDQVVFVILTQEIYSLCGISSGGFCSGTNQSSYSNAAEWCVSARNSFYQDDTCLNHYLALGQHSSATAVNEAATAICTSQRCKNRINSYVDFLITCQLENVILGDYEEGDSYLQLAYYVGNTTCRVDSTNTSCFSSIYFNQQLDTVSAAFDPNRLGVCIPAVSGNMCPPECMQILIIASDAVGCCFEEHGRATLGSEVFMTVLSNCNATSLSGRCNEPVAIQDANVGEQSGAVTLGRLEITVILVLGVITIMFSH